MSSFSEERLFKFDIIYALRFFVWVDLKLVRVEARQVATNIGEMQESNSKGRLGHSKANGRSLS